MGTAYLASQKDHRNGTSYSILTARSQTFLAKGVQVLPANGNSISWQSARSQISAHGNRVPWRPIWSQVLQTMGTSYLGSQQDHRSFQQWESHIFGSQYDHRSSQPMGTEYLGCQHDHRSFQPMGIISLEQPTGSQIYSDNEFFKQMGCKWIISGKKGYQIIQANLKGNFFSHWHRIVTMFLSYPRSCKLINVDGKKILGS